MTLASTAMENLVTESLLKVELPRWHRRLRIAVNKGRTGKLVTTVKVSGKHAPDREIYFLALTVESTVFCSLRARTSIVVFVLQVLANAMNIYRQTRRQGMVSL